MSVDYFSCDHCGVSVCDCGDYATCEGCGREYCTPCDENEVDIQEDDDGDQTCEYCRGAMFDESQIITWCCEKLEMTREEVETTMRVENG